MISKNKLKELSAYRLQKRCDEQAVFVVEGPKMASEALGSSFSIRVVCATAEWLAASADLLPPTTERFEVSPSELDRLSSLRSPNQVWMLLDRPALPPAPPADTPLILALDHIQDPGNLGTILRTADWYGIRHIVCSSDTVSSFNPKVVQASMGAIFRTSVAYTDLPRWLAGCHRPVYGASLHGQPLPETLLPDGPAVLLIGNESRGISPEAMASVSHPVLIPNRGGTAESLNASVAAAILIDRMLWNI